MKKYCIVMSLIYTSTIFADITLFEKLGDIVNQAAEIGSPSVVKIDSTSPVGTSPIGKQRAGQLQESGNGILCVIEGKQVIITNRHIIAQHVLGQSDIVITTTDRRLLKPKLIYASIEFDIAVIELDEMSEFPAAKFGDSNSVKRGNFIIVIGSPFGLDDSVSFGIVSATGRRRIPSIEAEPPRIMFFQIDAAVNPGSSGGPMLNLKGEVIGIVTAIATQGDGNQGVAFVMPINFALKIARQLITSGTAIKPFVGLSFDPAFSSAFEERKQLGIERNIGAKIKNVVPNSPAWMSGLQLGDVITEFNGITVEDDMHVVYLVADSDVGVELPITVVRGEKIVKLHISPR